MSRQTSETSSTQVDQHMAARLVPQHTPFFPTQPILQQKAHPFFARTHQQGPIAGKEVLQEKSDSSQQSSPNLSSTQNKTDLPTKLKSGIESLSGYAMDDVRVHYNSPKPAQLHAHAYAQGNQIHIAPGQEKHLPHEAWHVVQQKQGRVKPTIQMKGKVTINDDVKLEREADVMGKKALQSSVDISHDSISPISAVGQDQAIQCERLMTYEAFKAQKKEATGEEKYTVQMQEIAALYDVYRGMKADKKWEQALDQLHAIWAKMYQMFSDPEWNDYDLREDFKNLVFKSIEGEIAWLMGLEWQSESDQELGTDDSNTETPLSDRPIVKLTMNQGVVAKLYQMSLYSGNFSSCSPIAMYREDTKRGGLFHFPAGGLEGKRAEATKRRLTQMYKDVKPTMIWLTNQSYFDPSEIEALPDAGDITTFLKKSLEYKGEFDYISGRDSAYSFYLNEKNKPKIFVGELETKKQLSVMEDRSKNERSTLAKAWQGLPKVQKYGRDEYSHLVGETPPELPKTSKNRETNQIMLEVLEEELNESNLVY